MALVVNNQTSPATERTEVSSADRSGMGVVLTVLAIILLAILFAVFGFGRGGVSRSGSTGTNSSAIQTPSTTGVSGSAEGSASGSATVK